MPWQNPRHRWAVLRLAYSGPGYRPGNSPVPYGLSYIPIWPWSWHQQHLPGGPAGVMLTEPWLTGQLTLTLAVDAEALHHPAPAPPSCQSASPAHPGKRQETRPSMPLRQALWPQSNRSHCNSPIAGFWPLTVMGQEYSYLHQDPPEVTFFCAPEAPLPTLVQLQILKWPCNPAPTPWSWGLGTLCPPKFLEEDTVPEEAFQTWSDTVSSKRHLSS